MQGVFFSQGNKLFSEYPDFLGFFKAGDYSTVSK
jgi:hypothetical protein